MRDSRPHVVGVVGNDIVFDSRIRKVAAAAAAAGFRSTIVCYTAGTDVTKSSLPGVEVIRVPVDFRSHLKNGRVPAPLRPVQGAELAERHAGPRVYQQMRKRRIEAKVADPTRAATINDRIALFWARLAMRMRQDTFRGRRKLHTTIDKTAAKYVRLRRRFGLRLFRPIRDGVPNIADYEVTFGPILEELRPDLIHAHDYHMIGLAVTAARNLRASGTMTKVLYDAHELIEGLSYPQSTLSGWLRLESEFIRDADAVTGVSPEQVASIQQRYRLETTPTVVMNAPVGGEPDSTAVDLGPTLRDEIGVDGHILLYHGNVFAERGLSTLVESLAYLDGNTHVAVLAPADNPLVLAAQKQAEELDVAGRLHILSYVPTERLVHYISSADIAVVPYLHTGNNDIALPNKFFESIQAGLPTLVSNMRSLSRIVRESGIGEVFEGGSAVQLADKATEMIENLDVYRALITPELKKEMSWGAQASKLVALYGELLDHPVPDLLNIEISDIQESARPKARGSKMTKLVIGPRNMAGQAFAIASAVQANLDIPAISYSMETAKFGFPIHHQVSGEEWRDPAWQAVQRRVLRTEFTHVIAESGTGILGAMNGGFIDDQLPYLLEDGLQVAVLLHGSEIRDPRRHRELPHSPYAVEDEFTRTIVKANERLRAHLDALDLPFFVTTPDLLEDVNASWLPVVVSGRSWAELKPPFQSPIPTVLHLPSSSRMKGSEYVDQVLIQLENEGQVRYLRPDPPVTADQVSGLIESADIVIDQLVIGAYGLMSCQALSAGRIAIANVRDIGSLRAECPVVHADVDTLRETLTSLFDSRDEWMPLSDAGRAYVEKYHSGEHTAEVLRPFLSQTATR